MGASIEEYDHTPDDEAGLQSSRADPVAVSSWPGSKTPGVSYTEDLPELEAQSPVDTIPVPKLTGVASLTKIAI
jgi:hypothetical protein